jgi:hypothetical protein
MSDLMPVGQGYRRRRVGLGPALVKHARADEQIVGVVL